MGKKNETVHDELRELIKRRGELIQQKHLEEYDREMRHSIGRTKQAIARLEAELAES